MYTEIIQDGVLVIISLGIVYICNDNELVLNLSYCYDNQSISMYTIYMDCTVS